MNDILATIRRTIVPIRREGYPFIAIGAAAALVLFLIGGGVLGWIALAITAWIIYFFRDPPRVTPVAANLVISPADGQVSAVTEAVPPAELGLGDTALPRVSVFMNVFDVHVNRTPIAGRVQRMAYRAGKFLNAELDKASEDNERNSFVIEADAGATIAVVQIAGLVARRIVVFVEEGARLAPGERIGLIRFGSRVDVYLPVGTRPLVGIGQRAVAGETVLADLGSAGASREEGWRRG